MEIEYEGSRVFVRKKIPEGFGGVVAEKRKRRDSEVRKAFGHFRNRRSDRKQVAEIPFGPRSVEYRRDDQRNGPFDGELRREKEGPVPFGAEFPVTNVDYRSRAESPGASKRPYPSRI